MHRHDLVSKFVDFETHSVCVYVSYVCVCVLCDPGDRLKSVFKDQRQYQRGGGFQS